MKIEIHLRDTKTNGKRIGGRACVIESCRVFRESGDGVRLSNLATLAYKWFFGAALAFVNDDPANPSANGTLPTEARVAQYEK